MMKTVQQIPTEFKIAVIDNSNQLSYLKDHFIVEQFASQINAYNDFQINKYSVIINKIKSAHLDGFNFIKKLNDSINKETPYILISEQIPTIYKKKILESNVSDVYHKDDSKKLIKRLNFIKDANNANVKKSVKTIYNPKTGFWKRAVDISIAGIALLFASAIMLIVSIILKLQDSGPIMYKSRRVGTNFKIIGVFKFRTMIVDADLKINDIKDLNAYSNNSNKNYQNIQKSSLYDDSLEPISEQDFLNETRNTPVFLKFKSDPRVTKFGKILRKTSIDELPQLFNILKGDMSIVGNRPIPILEGDRLTTDESVARFLAPAGLTGYWQVTQRGTSNISQRDRIRMDNYYAKKRNFGFDFKIIFKTFKVLIQTENQ